MPVNYPLCLDLFAALADPFLLTPAELIMCLEKLDELNYNILHYTFEYFSESVMWAIYASPRPTCCPYCCLRVTAPDDSSGISLY